MSAVNILFHPNLPIVEAGRLARAQGCMVAYRDKRLRMVPAAPEALARCERSLALIDRALDRIKARDFAAALADVRAARETPE